MVGEGDGLDGRQNLITAVWLWGGGGEGGGGWGGGGDGGTETNLELN